MYLVSFADHRGAVAESETALFGDFLLFDNSALGSSPNPGTAGRFPSIPSGSSSGHPSSGNRRRYRSLFPSLMGADDGVGYAVGTNALQVGQRVLRDRAAG